MNRFRLLALFAPIMLMLSACGINSVPRAQEEAKAKWATVQAAFQRRANLIANLVETVRASAEAERGTLTDVTRARADASRITLSPDQLGDAEAMARYAQAQSQLSVPIIRQQMQEAYPDLQSQGNFATLMQQLEGNENRVEIAVRDYNEAVRAYNTEIRTFPSSIGARVIHGAQPMVPYESVTPGAEVAPTVNFDRPAGNRQ